MIMSIILISCTMAMDRSSPGTEHRQQINKESLDQNSIQMSVSTTLWEISYDQGVILKAVWTKQQAELPIYRQAETDIGHVPDKNTDKDHIPPKLE